MATPVFRLDAPASGSICSSLDGNRKSPLPRKEVPVVVNKPMPPVLAKKPLVQSLTSKLKSGPLVDKPRAQSCGPFPNANPFILSGKEFGNLSTAPTSIIKFRSSWVMQPPSKRSELSLLDISSAYSSALPVTVQVTSCGVSKLPLSPGEVLHVLAVKSNTVVSARSGTHDFVIPLNSCVPFSVLYNPDSNITKALEGHVFPNARELIDALVRPKVVCVAEPQKAIRGTDVRIKSRASVSSDTTSHANSIVNGEILVFDQTEAERELHVCKAFSLKSKSTKLVSDDCKFSFSTCPKLVSLFMTDIVQWIADQFPLKVAIAGKKVVPNINPTDITLFKVTTEQSLLCLNESCRANLIDIPVTEPAITVTIDETNSPKHLCTYGAEMMQNFKSDKLMYIRDPEIQEVQSFFYSQLQTGKEMAGVKLMIPLSITEHMRSSPKLQVVTFEQQSINII